MFFFFKKNTYEFYLYVVMLDLFHSFLHWRVKKNPVLISTVFFSLKHVDKATGFLNRRYKDGFCKPVKYGFVNLPCLQQVYLICLIT